MTAGFGDFANIDIEKLLNGADSQFARMEELQETMGTLVGHAQDDGGLVTVEYAAEGIRELVLHPKALRLSASELAEKIKIVIAEATADLQKQVNEAMGEVFGEEDNPMKFVNDPDAAINQIKDAEAAYNRTFEDVMGELDRIRRRMDL
ncbi:YbaB/EbfC family nucleoid-associated protein [Streptosporangium sp. NBC_01756]|uniref:YbaB/EbfC family nucleoid-associated protein n=1 Tax=Streptosporangium sp. NBC_01756 TaxID=2975950 RepID=UPI002DD840F8|nr:YbaB/EbfC family nucleoid-associated protein [Streptosporangium sp. NBC_01756]WSC88870.1 YbaB/EbfC family nucleoid-associated protein [Streptosporangium sp. NBC_01756]